MADFTLPARPKRRTSQAPTLPISALPGRGDQSQSGVEGFLTRLPAGMGAGTPNYQAGIDQSRGGQLAAGLPEVQDQVATAQAQSLQEHKAYREGLQATQQQVDTRNKDLKLVENLLIATDPGTDKAVRKFMLAGISNAVGVDPKGEYSQGLQKMVLGMAPEGLEALRSSFSDDIRNSPPGAIHAKLGAMFSGDIPVENVIGQVKEHQEARADAARGLTHPGVPLTSGTTPDIAGSETTAELAGGAAVTPGAAPPSAQQRQAVIQAAGLSDAPTATAPPETPVTPSTIPEPAAPPEELPPAPIPPTSDDSGALPVSQPPEPASPPPPPPQPAPTATAEGPLAEPAPAAPTAATPPPDLGKVEVTPEMRQAAEQSGDEIFKKAIKLLDQRNAVLDSAAIHRGQTAGPSPSGPAFLPSTQTLPYTGPPIDPSKKGATPPTEGLSDAPTAQQVSPEGTGEAAPSKSIVQSAIEALPADPITGIKPSESENAIPAVLDSLRRMGARIPEDFKKTLELAVYGKNPFVEDMDKVLTQVKEDAQSAAGLTPPSKEGAAGTAAELSDASRIAARGNFAEATTTASPYEIHQQDLTASNAQARRNPKPRNPNGVEALKPEEIPPGDQELDPRLRALPGFKEDKRYNVDDARQRYSRINNNPDYVKKTVDAIDKKAMIAEQMMGSTTDISEVLNTKAGQAATGGVKANIPGMGETTITPGNISKFKEGVGSLLGLDGKQQKAINTEIDQKVNQWKASRPDLSSEEIAIAGARLDAHLTRYAFATAAAFNPRGQISNKDVEFAAKNVGSLDMTSPMISAILKDSLDTSLRAARGEVAALTGTNLPHDWSLLPEEERKRILLHHAKTADAGKSPYNLNDIKDIATAQREAEAKRAGAPENENKYIVPRGGNRPEDYDYARTAKAKLERETHEQTKDLQQKKYDMDVEKWKYTQEQDAERKARQAMLDARHAQEKMAAAFQHIGAMIAGSVKGGSVGGGSGISAGGEDSSAFRIAPSPQRAAPRVAPATGITRYGGPIKKQ